MRLVTDVEENCNAGIVASVISSSTATAAIIFDVVPQSEMSKVLKRDDEINFHKAELFRAAQHPIFRPELD